MSRSTKNSAASHTASNSSGAEKCAFVERLQMILAQWPSADRLARTVGVSPSAFRKWLKGEAEPSRERLVALARASGVGIGWLADGSGPQPAFEAASGGRRRNSAQHIAQEGTDWRQFTVLPRRPAAAAAGPQTPNAAVAVGFLALRHDWVRAVCRIEPEQLIAEIAAGESMSPTIRDGHVLLIDSTDRTFRNYGVYVLTINGERLVKRVQRRHDGSLVLISDNPAYLPDVVERAMAETVEVVGRVVWAGGTVV